MLSRNQCRAADRLAIESLGIPAIVLMENAGRSCAETLLALRTGDGVVICCGPGNNGGDGFVIARHLFNAGIRVTVILFAAPEKYTGAALINLRIIERLKMRIIEFNYDWNAETATEKLVSMGRFSATWIVDAILGTGSTGPLRSPLQRIVELINATDLNVLAVDIPTGLDCDTGDPAPVAIRADVTCTFIAAKTGFQNPKSAPYLGHLKVIGIGAPNDVIIKPEGQLGERQ